MNRQYVDIPTHTSIFEIFQKNCSLSATQYKLFSIKNNNKKTVGDFLSRPIQRSDLGVEVGSQNYVTESDRYFIKTRALQSGSFLIDEGKEAIIPINPQKFVDMQLKKGDILISKDGNVGEVVILEEDYENAMLCSAIYKLPVTEKKYYLLAFIKSDLFRQQIDFLVPKGSTIRHGKTKFLDCFIPLPNSNVDDTITFVEEVTKVILEKEFLIKQKHCEILLGIHKELEENQNDNSFSFSLPKLNEIMELGRMDSSLYSEQFKRKEFTIKNYKNGTSTIKELGFSICRGQNLQVSNIGKSIQTTEKIDGYYNLVLPKFLSKYGTINKVEYIGNSNSLKTLEKGDVIFGAEGNEKGRSIVVIENDSKSITNIHGITLNQQKQDLTKGIFVKLFLDYLRDNGMIDDYAVGSNGGSLAIKYWDLIKIPRFPVDLEKKLVEKYSNSEAKYEPELLNLKEFLEYDSSFNKIAGIFELDKSLKFLKNKLACALNDIANDVEVETWF